MVGKTLESKNQLTLFIVIGQNDFPSVRLEHGFPGDVCCALQIDTHHDHHYCFVNLRYVHRSKSKLW